MSIPWKRLINCIILSQYQGEPHAVIKVPHDRTSHALSKPNTTQHASPSLSIFSVDQGFPRCICAVNLMCSDPLGFLCMYTCVLCTCTANPALPTCTDFPYHTCSVCTHSGWEGGEGLKQGKKNRNNRKHLSENVQSLLSPFLPSFAAGLTHRKYIKD